MADYHVTAWNMVDARGRPIIEIDRDMTREECSRDVDGKYVCVSMRLLRPISREVIDRSLAEEMAADPILDELPGFMK